MVVVVVCKVKQTAHSLPKGHSTAPHAGVWFGKSKRSRRTGTELVWIWCYRQQKRSPYAFIHDISKRAFLATGLVWFGLEVYRWPDLAMSKWSLSYSLLIRLLSFFLRMADLNFVCLFVVSMRQPWNPLSYVSDTLMMLSASVVMRGLSTMS